MAARALGAKDRAHDRGVAPAVLRLIGSVDFVVDLLGLDQADVPFDPVRTDSTLVARLGAAEPGGAASVDGPDVKIVAGPNDPHRHRPPQAPVAPDRSEFKFLGLTDLV